MKLLTKEEEDAHYREVVKGGSFGTVLGLVGGYAGVMLASRRYPTVRNLTIPMKAFLVTSSGTFVGIVSADRASRAFEISRNKDRLWYENRGEQLRQQEVAGMSFADRALAWARQERYTIVGVTWLASMVGSFALVGRNPYLSGQQKLVQARVYAQGLTLAVLVASAAFEISERRRVRREIEERKEKNKGQEGSKVETTAQSAKSGDEGDLWKEMVAAEEERLKKKHQPVYEQHETAKAESGKESPEEAEAFGQGKRAGEEKK
ncbi:hypothetical protein BJX61DRAFT_425941 [Aspergillus egyptiacus]|nr:hypothetical protein BJX61DRAFT_425941 [Aspergillus egyptiacus]